MGGEGRHTHSENSRSEERPEIKNAKLHLCTALNVLCTARTVFIAYVYNTYTIVRKYGRALMFPSDYLLLYSTSFDVRGSYRFAIKTRIVRLMSLIFGNFFPRNIFFSRITDSDNDNNRPENDLKI